MIGCKKTANLCIFIIKAQPFTEKIINEKTELKQDNFTHIVDIAQTAAKDTRKLAEIQKAKAQIWSNPGRAAGIIADFLIQKQQELSKKEKSC